MTDDDRLDPDALVAFTVPAPAADLGDRFAIALAAQRARRRRQIVIGAAAGIAVAAAAAAIAIAVVRPGSTTPAPAHGAVAATERTTARLGTRGIAVVEAGARLDWNIAGTAAIRQDAGNVFYRVEPGGAFTVTTPAGAIRDVGTCFRVEIEPGPLAVVTVYEGAVEVVNPQGTLALAAGDRAIAAAGIAPRLAPAPALASASAATATGELAIRDREQRERIAALEAELARRGTAAGAAGSTGPVAMGDVDIMDAPRPIDMTRDQLAELAADCRFPFDVPPIAGSTMMDQLFDAGVRAARLTDAEQAAVRRVIDELQPAYQTQLTALYRELTGIDAELDPSTLVLEIEQKSPERELLAAYQRLAAERAGTLSPRPVTASTTVIERYLRLAVAAADNFERRLAADIGADRARAFRRTWGMVDFAPGCPAQ